MVVVGEVVQVKPAGGRRLAGADLVEEVEWLLSFGMHPERVASALGCQMKSLERALLRQSRSDLARVFWKVAA